MRLRPKILKWSYFQRVRKVEKTSKIKKWAGSRVCRFVVECSFFIIKSIWHRKKCEKSHLLFLHEIIKTFTQPESLFHFIFYISTLSAYWPQGITTLIFKYIIKINKLKIYKGIYKVNDCIKSYYFANKISSFNSGLKDSLWTKRTHSIQCSIQ